MIVENIKNLVNVWPSHTKMTEYKTLVDPKTHKEYTSVVVYHIYNEKGKIESNQLNKVDVRV